MIADFALATSDAVLLLAEEPKGEEFGKSSPLGLLVIVLLLVGTALLIRSMNKQLKKLPESFDTANPEPDQAFDEGTDAGAALAGSDGSDPGSPAIEDHSTDERRPAT